MNNLPELQSAFSAVDEWIGDNLRQAGALGGAATDTWRRRRFINQEAYFILAWGQLEREIDEACREVIRRRRSALQWELRRGFDLYNPDDRRLSGLTFDDRVRLVIESDRDRSRTLGHYELRNRIAHGKAFATGIDFVAVVREFYLISSSVSR